ncbi:hypothetical protein EV363DRAFT_1354922 [Boletus edulis]|nr:hypothetical protein EV363DRAFT_1354922 [Boletus edulis]
MTLGSLAALARMEVPVGRLRSLLVGAASTLAIARLVIIPVFGVPVTQGLNRVGLLDTKDNVPRFACMHVLFPVFFHQQPRVTMCMACLPRQRLRFY